MFRFDDKLPQLDCGFRAVYFAPANRLKGALISGEVQEGDRAMIQQVLNKQLLLDVLDSMNTQMQASAEEGRRAGTGSPFDELRPTERTDLQEGIAAAKEFLAKEEQTEPDRRGGDAEVPLADRTCYLPRSPELSNLQSAIEEYFLEQHPEVLEFPGPDDRRGGTSPITGSQLTIWQDYLADRRLFGAFEQTDIGWINALFAEGVRRFRKKHSFIERPVRNGAIPLPDEKVRIIIVGDWGSGIPRAQNVAMQIRKKLDDEKVRDWQKHVIHLGDVYYAGWEFEYKNRFLRYWPVEPKEKDKIGSFAVNGNHDMYSGGWGYYNCALADERFAAWQGKSSLFHLANNYWQIFGLDTSHDDAGLKGDQAAWVRGAARAGLKTMILSHHQYCSAYEDPAKNLIARIEPVLTDLDVVAWLWGHEHRCMTFKDVGRVRFPRCIGHGGVPVYQTHGFNDKTPPPGEWEYRDYLDAGLEHWAKFGFVVLDFKGESIDVAYVNENGGEDRQETIQ